jgi:hypothetical protein
MRPDDPYSLEQLKSPRMNVSIVRPFVDQMYDMHDISVGMALLLPSIPLMYGNAD